MKTAPTRPQTKQVMVCRDGRTVEPDFVVGGDVTGFTANQVAVAAADGTLAGSSGLTYNGTTFAITGAATVSTTLGVTGDTTLGGNLLFSAATFLVAANTVDASDSSVLELCGGGAFSSARGAIIALYGNENANHGWLRMIAGDDSGNGTITLNTAGTTWFTLSRAGLITHTGALAVSGATTLTANTASTTTTTGTLVVTGGAGFSGAIFAGDTITGTKDGSVGSLLGGLVARNASDTTKNIIIGVTTADIYFIQSNKNGTGSRPLTINSGGGNVLIGTSTDDGTNNLQVSGSAKIASTTTSTSTTTGALIVSGGAGIAGALYIGGTTVWTGGSFPGNNVAGAYATATDGLIITGGTGTTSSMVFLNNLAQSAITVEHSGTSVLIGGGGYATNTVTGFLQISSCAGAPTGTPTGGGLLSNAISLMYDRTNNKIYAYNGSWRSTAALT